ncbi:hypothetical protein OCK74_09740 [Chitinophagaceae bacterium LB-8]|uniref:DUF4239 domain-containing protein n=1 Tax=Paraflavisolibacter caeni TaxID=2982496 RepID=A0A9X3B895_9BACT|nr:hypothetical protein [Paraflavisolibacter caeni]MCU7549396.1 hypothetical protein [Paraflavisolibacter caeni]
MNITSFINFMPSWMLFILIIIVGMLIAEAGAYIAGKRLQKGEKEPDTPVNSALGAMLALLGFMLGFTFSITANRFAERRELVIRQANAIGTCYLRTSMIPERQKSEVRKLFREYVDNLLQIQKTENVNVPKSISRMNDIHLLIWNQTASLAKEDMDSELRSLFTSSVNEVIDIASERETIALLVRIPSILWISLIALFIMSMFLVGYQIASFDIRRIYSLPLLIGAVAMVLVLIAEMDSSEKKGFRISQKPLENVREMLQTNIP